MSAETVGPSLDRSLDAATDDAGRLHFIQTLQASRAWIITDRPWDGHSKPGPGIRLLLIGEEGARRQAMAVVFTRRERAEGYLKTAKTGDDAFRNMAEPPMVWVLLGLPPGIGITIDPGSPRGMQLSAEDVAEMRRDAERSIASVADAPASPDDPQAILQRIYEALDADDVAGAETWIAVLRECADGDEYTLCAKALVAKHRSDYPLAKELLARAIEALKDPQARAEIWWLSAQVHLDAAEPHLAEQAFKRARELDPAKAEYTVDLAIFYSGQDKTETALQILHDAMLADPSEPTYMINRCRVLMDANRHEEALARLAEFCISFPALKAFGLFNQAACLQVLGKLDEARSTLEEALTLDPMLNGHQQYVNLLKTAKGQLPASRKYVELLQRRAQDDMPVVSRIDSYFTLARIHEAANDFNRAFEYMHRANSLKRSTLKWSLSDTEEEFGRVIGLFDRGFIERFRERIPSDLKPVFVLGMPRSGTTLTEQILAAHSQINPGGELNFLTRLGMPFAVSWSATGMSWGDRQDEILADLKRVADGYTTLTAGYQAPGKRFTDKMPGNFMHIGLIYLLFPGASVVHCMRDPVDNCLSCYERQFSKGLFFSYDLKELAGYYRLYRRIMRHWREVLPQGFILDLQYEEMVADPETQIRRLLGFCDLPFEEACMNFHEVERSVKTASMLQVRQPMYKTSVARWKKYGERLAPLLEALGPELPAR